MMGKCSLPRKNVERKHRARDRQRGNLKSIVSLMQFIAKPRSSHRNRRRGSPELLSSLVAYRGKEKDIVGYFEVKSKKESVKNKSVKNVAGRKANVLSKPRSNSVFNFCPRPSRRMKLARPKFHIKPDNDVWVETTVFSKSSPMSMRRKFVSKRTGLFVWDEPPSGATDIIRFDEVTRIYVRVPLTEQIILPIKSQEYFQEKTCGGWVSNSSDSSLEVDTYMSSTVDEETLVQVSIGFQEEVESNVLQSSSRRSCQPIIGKEKGEEKQELEDELFNDRGGMVCENRGFFLIG